MNTVEISTTRAITRRLIPFVFILGIFSYLDRVNVGFAALQMNADLGFTPEIFGFGVALFFIGYLVFEIPSNLLMNRVGPRFWIARIAITWGMISVAMALISGTKSFYFLRFVLGIAEAGLVPGVLLYISRWFPSKVRAAALSNFMLSSAVSIAIGAPISGAIMSIGDAAGLKAWQWLFILEGLPSVLLGVAVLFYLTDKPRDATWLAADQRNWLDQKLAQELAEREDSGVVSFVDAISNKTVWLLAAVYFCIGGSFYGISFWLPQIVRALSGGSHLAVGFLTAVPPLCGAIAMIANGKHSDRTGDRKWHVLIALATGFVGFAIGAYAPTPVISFIGLCIGAIGIWGSVGVFWALPTAFLSGSAAAAGLALINSMGNVGGFIGPYLMGWLRGRNPDFNASLLLIAGFLILGTLLMTLLSATRSGLDGSAQSKNAVSVN